MASKLAILIATGSASAAATTPVAKVTKLLTDLKTQVQAEGTAEAGTYDEFACFCKDGTATKSESITTGKDTIDTTSADIAEFTAQEAEKASELMDRKAKQESLKAELESETIRCQKESAVFEAKILDMTKALTDLGNAIKSMKAAKPDDASLLSVQKSVQHSLALADAMNLIKPTKHKAVQAFLQGRVDPDAADYEFHSGGILETIESLETSFTEKKESTQGEWDKHSTACDELKLGLEDEIKVNGESMVTLSEDIDSLKADIASKREELVNAEAQLKDDQVYLKDLTTRCEERAKQWDQRSGLRANEVEALSQALTIIEGTVTEKDAVNVRALLLQNATAKSANATAVNSTVVKNGTITAVATNSTKKMNRTELLKNQQSSLKELMSHLKGSISTFNKAESKGKDDSAREVDEAKARLDEDYRKLNQSNLSAFEFELYTNRTRTDKSMVQYWGRQRESAHSMFHANLKMTHTLMSKVKSVMEAYEEMLSKGKLSKKASQQMKSATESLRGGKAALIQEHSELTQERIIERKDEAKYLLNEMAKQLKSPSLAAIASKVASDPFSKVKGLIQKLVERLIAESTAEATKKGFCDTELGKAKHDRDYRWTDSGKITAEVSTLHAKEDSLAEAVTTLSEALTTTTAELREAGDLRTAQKDENLQAVKDARQGLEAITEAIGILKTFYKQSAKASALLQASPVDEDEKDAGFSGAYKGNQESSKGIIGLLEVIKSDFERTKSTTESQEKKSAAEFVEFDRMSKADISSKETGIELNKQDLETTKINIEQKTRDLEGIQGLLDSALKTIEDLKPTCIDTGMSFEERVAKREAEIEALKKALCLLDPEGKEADCSA